MARCVWPHLGHRPQVQINLESAGGGAPLRRNLLADTGAGTARAGFELLFDEQDCVMAGGIPSQTVVLGGAYRGTFPVYLMRVRIPELTFDHHVYVVGVPTVPPGFDGIACFRFLNRFAYGNFGDPSQFGIEA